MLYYIKTYGCQMNHSDSERITTLLDSFGHNQATNVAEADIIIFNTCQIKQHAEDKVLGHFKNFKNLRAIKPRIIGIVGCMTRKTSTRLDEKLDQDFYINKHPGAFDFSMQIKDLNKLPGILRKFNKEVANVDESKAYFELTPTTKSKYQVMVPISAGCNKFCAYCVVPFARGREVYRPVDEILEEIKTLKAEGAKELTLLGQNVNSYHPECGTNFAQLLDRVATENPDIPFIRMTSPYPTDFSEDVIRVIAKHPNISRCLHMPLQAGSDAMLKKMNRRYTQEEYLDLIDRIKTQLPDATFTTDIITGYSGETPEDFEQTVKVYKEVEFDLAFVSPYSKRRGTFAFNLPDDVDQQDKKARFNVLQDLQEEIALKKNKAMIGKECEVLVEKVEGDHAFGRSLAWNYISVAIPADTQVNVGDIIKVKVVDGKTWLLEAELI